MRVSTALIGCTALCLAAQTVLAQEGHSFPGKGEKSKWKAANKPYNEAVGLYRTKNYDAAIAKYKAAIEIYPDDYEFFNNLGLAYKQKNELEEALESFKKSIALKDNSWESWSNIGNIYRRQNHPQEAVDAYTKALQFNPPASKRAALMQNVSGLKQQAK